MVGTQSIRLVYTLRDYSTISVTDFFTITFLDLSCEPGNAFVETTAQTEQSIFKYSG